MKKRYVLKNKRRFMIAVAILVSIISSIIIVTTRTQGYSEISCREIVIERGDTLWDIAVDKYGENIDVRKKVALIKKVNDMETSELFAGQVLLIPEN